VWSGHNVWMLELVSARFMAEPVLLAVSYGLALDFSFVLDTESSGTPCASFQAFNVTSPSSGQVSHRRLPAVSNPRFRCP